MAKRVVRFRWLQKEDPDFKSNLVSTVEPVGQLAFQHSAGDCVNVANNKVVLCFNVYSGDYNKCRMAASPTGAFSEMKPSQHEHSYTRIATDNELIIAVGDRYLNKNKKTELLDVNGNNWSSADDYPFVSRYIRYAPIVHVSDSFYLFGGQSDSSDESTIGRLDIKTRKWSNAGSLMYARSGHNAIYDGQYVLVVGGYETFQTEKCSISNNQITCSSQSPELYYYAYYPEVFLVPEGYCKQL